LRGFEGFGSRGIIHAAKILRLSIEQPVVIEIVDITEKIEAFIPVLDEAIPEGLATFQNVQVRF
jgi:PII-like signaling protein